MDLAKAYQTRFESTGLEKRDRVWRVLCKHFFNDLVGSDKDVLDLACGYGEFINNVSARTKTGADLNPDAKLHLAKDVRFVHSPATGLPIDDSTFDVVFASNFLEHLADKAECDRVFAEVRRILRPGGRFIVMGPNIKYCTDTYWDYYDHHLPLSHVSLEEGMTIAGFAVEKNIPQFLPFTMKGKTPSHDLLIRLYLAFPFAWKFMGHQFLVVATKPANTRLS